MIGRTLGHYEIVSQLGAGGMGVVYAARDERLGRDVALKVLPPAMSEDPDLRARFQREAKAVAALRHPGIVTIHSIEEHDGVHFITMELVDGEPLGRHVPAGGMELSRFLETAISLADAVGAAHSRGITHRDLKPANILVDPAGRVKVLDFGLAKFSDTIHPRPFGSARSAEAIAETAFVEDITAEGRILGTVHYMSPEQAEARPVGPPADVFALGILLYEMATGEKPFRGESPISILSSILKDDPAPITDRNPALPPELDRIVQRCLAKDSSLRYPDANQLRGDLERLRGQLSAGTTASPSSRIGAPVSTTDAPASTMIASATNNGGPGRVYRTLSVVLATVLGLSLLVFVFTRMRADEPSPALGASGRPSVAVFEFRTHGADEEIRWLASGVPSLLLTGLAETPGLDVVSSARIEELLNKIGKGRTEEIDRAILSQVARRSGAGAVVLGNIFKSGDTIRIDVQVEDVETGRLLFARDARGSDVYDIVDRLSMEIREGLDLATSDQRSVAEVSSGSLDAYRAYDEGVRALNGYRLADAARLLTHAVTLDPEFALAHAKLAELAGYQRDVEAEQLHLERARELSAHLPERQRQMVEAEYQLNVQRDPESARGTLERLIASFPGEVDAYLLLGSPILQGGDQGAALEIIRRGVEAVPTSGALRNQYAYLLRATGRTDEAIRELEMYQALAPEEVNPRDSLGEIYLTSGRPREALQKYDEVVALDPSFESAHRGRALALACLGRFPEAIESFDRSLALIEETGLSARALRSSKAILLLHVGRYREALELAEMDDAEFPRQDDEPGHHVRLVRMMLSMRSGAYSDCAEAARQVMQRVPPEAPAIFKRAIQGVALQHEGASEARLGNFTRAEEIQKEERVGLGPDILAPWGPDWIAGEIALAKGELEIAEAAFRRGAPTQRVPFTNSQPGLTGGLALNHPPSRDWNARLLAARGDLDGAIAAYRELNEAHGSPFTSMYEPLFVLATARLLHEKGDRAAALREYQMFLELWKDADEGLPEKEEAKRYVQAASG